MAVGIRSLCRCRCRERVASWFPLDWVRGRLTCLSCGRYFFEGRLLPIGGRQSESTCGPAARNLPHDARDGTHDCPVMSRVHCPTEFFGDVGLFEGAGMAPHVPQALKKTLTCQRTSLHGWKLDTRSCPFTGMCIHQGLFFCVRFLVLLPSCGYLYAFPRIYPGGNRHPAVFY